MSQTSGSIPPTGGATPRVSMRKNLTPVEKVPVRPSVRVAVVALAVTILGLAIAAIGTHTASYSALAAYETWSNAHAKSPKKPYTTLDVAGDIHNFRNGTTLEAVLIGVVLVALAVMLLRTRTASPARWGMTIILVVAQVPFYVFSHPHDLPSTIRLGDTVAGVASIAAIVLVFLPQSSVYFRACREAALPPERRGQARPGLFGPRAGAPGAAAGAGRPGAARPGAARWTARTGTGSTGPTAPGRTAPGNPSAGKTRAKVRADADAVAKGAELARARARASKSRRTDA